MKPLRIPSIHFTRIADPVPVRYKDKSKHPYRRRARLIDRQEYLEIINRPDGIRNLVRNLKAVTRYVEITNTFDWHAFRMGRYSLIFVWR